MKMRPAVRALVVVGLLMAVGACHLGRNSSGGGEAVDVRLDANVQIAVFTELLKGHHDNLGPVCLQRWKNGEWFDIADGILRVLRREGFTVQPRLYCLTTWKKQEPTEAEPMIFSIDGAAERDGMIEVRFSRVSAYAYRHPLGLGSTGGTCILVRTMQSSWAIQGCGYVWTS